MDTERRELIEKRNMVHETMRWLAECLHFDLYFAQRQKYDEIKAVFIDQYDRHYQIVVRLDEVGDRAELFDNLRTYFEYNHSNGRYFDGRLVIENKDESSIYPSVMQNFKFDTAIAKRILNYQYGYKPIIPSYFKIKKVIFNDPATIVIWADGSKTVVKCQPGDTFNKETGLAMAISKRALGDKRRYYEKFKKWIPELKEEVKTELEPAIVNPYEDAMRALKNFEVTLNKYKYSIPELKINYPNSGKE